MRKKYGRIAVFVVGCILAVWGMILYPILNRGTLIVSFTNQTDSSYTVLRLNDQQVNELLEPNGMLDVDFVITGEGPVTAYLESESGEVLERVLTEGLTTSVTPNHYGRVLLTVKEKKGVLELNVISNISD